MDRIDEILFLYEDDVVEMKDGGFTGKKYERMIEGHEMKRF